MHLDAERAAVGDDDDDVDVAEAEKAYWYRILLEATHGKVDKHNPNFVRPSASEAQDTSVPSKAP